MMSSRHGGGRAVRSGLRGLEGGISGLAPPEGIKELIGGSVYLLSEPGNGAPNLEVVFIHGLTVEDYHDAYWRTWTVGNNDRECWPMKFLKADFPNARILSVCYDSSLFVTGAAGMSDLDAAGETLVSALVEKPVSVGQNNCPIVFVCHSLGGLLAKKIVLHANGELHRNDPEYKNFLHNIRGFQFYSTPHLGSRLADLAWSLFYSYRKAIRSKMAKALDVINDDVGRLNAKFDAVKDGQWVWSNVVEKNETLLECGFHGLVVTETSARLGPKSITIVDSDHFGVCKPESTTSRSYISLKNLIHKIVEGISQDAVKSRRGIFGIDDELQNTSEMLAKHSVIGLWGMGGIGKTTLIKCWYDQEREKRNYIKFCFLENVKDRKIEDCQKDLYSCLIGSGWEGQSKDDQLRKIKEYIMSNKVLLVVDDVDDEKQLEALQLEGFKYGMSGSSMTVTSRQRDVLVRSGISSAEGILELQYLNDEHALEIFSYKAFSGVGENVELAKFKDQAKVIVKACGGLPLSLEVIGSYLRGSFDIRIWEEVVVKLQRAVSLSGSAEDKLWATLMISYKKLDDEHKSMFLDFASVICEMGLVTRRTLEAIWDTPSGVRNLIDRSLIKLNNDNDSITMHDQLRDLGRHVVRGNPDEPKNRSRIWERGVKGLEIMMLNEGHQHLEGVSLHEVTNEDLKRIKKSLQSEGLLIGPSHLNFEKLRLLNLHAFGAEVLDYCVNLCSEERLMCLRLSGSQISHNVCKNIFKKLGSFRNLRVLQIRGFPSSDKLTLPDEIGELTQLRMLWLTFRGLDKLPESVCKLSLLEELDLTRTSIVSLPDEIGELKGLRKLLLEDSPLCELPDSVCKLSLLEELDLSSTWIKSLPDEIGELKGLRNLLLEDSHLCELPDSVCKLSLLEKLDLSSTRITSLPDEIGELKGLRKLLLQGSQLCELPDSVCKLSLLEELYLLCTPITSLPDEIGELKGLRKLLLQVSCLCKLPDSVCKLSLLEELDLMWTWIKSLPDEIGELKGLRKLLLKSSPLCELPDSVCKLSLLEELDVRRTSIKSLPDEIGELKGLRKLLLKSSPLCELPDSVCKLSLLEELDVRRTSIKSLPDEIGELKGLRKLLLQGSPLCELPDSVCKLSLLEELDLMWTSIKSLPDEIGELKGLRKLLLRGSKLCELPDSVCKLSLLEELDLSCTPITSLPDEIGELKGLRKLLLEVSCLCKLPDSVCKLSLLEELDLTGAWIKVLPDEIGELKGLRKLLLRGSHLCELPESVCKLSLLEKLDVRRTSIKFFAG